MALGYYARPHHRSSRQLVRARLEALPSALQEGIRGWGNIGTMAEMPVLPEQLLGVWQGHAR